VVVTVRLVVIVAVGLIGPVVVLAVVGVSIVVLVVVRPVSVLCHLVSFGGVTFVSAWRTGSNRSLLFGARVETRRTPGAVTARQAAPE
jgi:hypothetical protein